MNRFDEEIKIDSEPATAHTPGPWIAQREPDARNLWRVVAKSGGLVATIWQNGENETNPANARLIAAAPDLLEALEGVLRIADCKTVEFDAAHAALAKAKGRTT